MKEENNIIMYDKPKVPSHKINHRNIIEGYMRGFGSKVGVYSNHATCIEAIKANLTKPEQKHLREELERRKKLLREIVGAEIDSTKGLAKPKEPDYFTKMVKIDPDDDDVTKAEKYAKNSLVVAKKPYFFRYLYPELNTKYKAYEAVYNKLSKTKFATKIKTLVDKEDKTKEEMSLVRKFNRFSPVINSKCVMNILCKEIENVDFDIKWANTNECMLPYYDLSEYEFDAAKLKEIRRLYQMWCNKREVVMLDSMFDDCDPDDAEYKEIHFGLIDVIRDEIIERYKSLNLSTMDGLTYIRKLSEGYEKFNFDFAYDIFGEEVLDVIEEQDSYVPVESKEGFEYFGKKYKFQKVNKVKKVKYIDFEVVEGVGYFE